MKKVIVVASLALSALALLPTRAMAQAESTAIRLTGEQEHRGSARYQALSGAMGAVGADFSAVNQNPASVALFRMGNRLSLTGSHATYSDEAKWYAEQSKDKERRLGFEELSYMTSWVTQSGQSWTLGFGIRQAGRFQSRLDSYANLSSTKVTGLADYTVGVVNRLRISPSSLGGSAPSVFENGAPWLGILGYKAGWIDSYESNGNTWYDSAFAYDNGTGKTQIRHPQSAGLVHQEKGDITDYDFALGWQPNSVWSFGATLTFTRLEYELFSSYSEGYASDVALPDASYGLSLDNRLSISGGGFRMGFGVLAEPLSGLRLGASVYTPTFYSLKQDYSAYATGVSPLLYDGSTNQHRLALGTPGGAANSFVLRMPWRFGLSAAYIFGHRGLISADYEYHLYGATRLGQDDDDTSYIGGNPYTGDNNALSDDMGGRHTLRVGAELMATKRLALRAGYRYSSSPIKSSALASGVTPSAEVLIPGTQVQYALPRNTYSFSLGLGYRLSPYWTLDVAYVNTRLKSDVYAFPAIKDVVLDANNKEDSEWLSGMDPVALKRSRSQLIATISYRF